MEQIEIAKLYRKYLKQELSETERSAFEQVLLQQDAQDRQVLNQLIDEDWSRLQNEELLMVSGPVADRIFNEIIQKEIKPSFNPVKILAVAAALAAIVFGVWFFQDSSSRKVSIEDQLSMRDIAPGNYGASITLADGKVIRLDSAKKRLVVSAGISYADGSVVSGDQRAHTSVQTQTLIASTAKGQTYEFILPDGTVAYLNADSKLQFPSHFPDKERRVYLQGEAYFSVRHDQSKPFLVESSRQVVEDIGTEFNINAYPDENQVKTTLVEGSAAVSSLANKSQKKILTPNQQALVDRNHIAVRMVDPEEVIDWKSGKIIFDDEPLESIMKRVCRWYNVDVIYKDDITDLRFGGAVSRSKKISAVLNVLSKTGNVQISLQGRTITISRNNK